jgi:hypothetical protein
MLLALAAKAAMDLDDKLAHWILGSGGLLIGSFGKAALDWLGEKLWRKTKKAVKVSAAEHKEFKEWKATHKKKG